MKIQINYWMKILPKAFFFKHRLKYILQLLYVDLCLKCLKMYSMGFWRYSLNALCEELTASLGKNIGCNRDIEIRPKFLAPGQGTPSSVGLTEF